MENKTPVIQNERGHTLTEEQIEILKHIKHSNEDLKIKAFAGTGKTSTLRTIAEFTQKINYIYMAYNKAIQVEAQSTFPPNVSCKTAHSLAYSALGIWKSSYKEKLANKIKFTEYLDAISYKHSFDKFVFFQDLVYCQRMFENSSDSEFLTKHIPSSCAHKNADYHLMLLEYAKKLWKLKIDRSNKIPIDHDTYLKLWQLQNPVINTEAV